MIAATLGDVADWGSGGTPKRDISAYFGAGIPWVSIADLNDGIVTGAKESLTELGIANSTAKVIPPGTLLVAMYGSIGKLGIAATTMCTSQAIAFAKPRLDLVDVRYLFHFLLAERPKLQSRGRGGTQMNIGQADLKSWPIPLPTLDEQRRIAAILDQADALRAKRRQALAHLNELGQSMFLDMFGDPVPTWPKVKIGEIAEVKGGKRLPKGASYSGAATAHPYIRVADLKDGSIATERLRYLSPEGHSVISRYTVGKGDVVISIAGSVGLVASVPDSLDGANLTENAAKIVARRSDYYDPAWLAFALRSSRLQEQIRSHVGQVTIGKLALFRIEKLELALPPLDIQRTLLARLEPVDREVERCAAVLAGSEELFASLQARAFRGEL